MARPQEKVGTAQQRFALATALEAKGQFAEAAAALEQLVPGDIKGLAPLAQRYTLFTDPDGGILDDLMRT